MAIKACDERIFLEGEAIALLQGSPEEIEYWVRLVGREAGADVDWHAASFAGQMLHLGSSASRARVEDVLNRLSKSLGPKRKQRMDKVFTKRLAPYEPGIRRDCASKVFPSIVRA